MKCVKCSKTFENPLMLYNGKTACPHCCERIAVASTFEVTAESEEFYRLGEICWFRHLEDPDDTKYIKKCIEYCTRAAHAGHPKAILRLGYLYETGYCSSGLSRSECGRISSGYYSALCFLTKPVPSNGIGGYDETAMTEIKTLAAKRLWYVVSSFARSASVSKTNSALVSELKGKLSQTFPTVKFGAVKINGADGGLDLSSKLASCFDATRAPVFGLLKISAAEFVANGDKIEAAVNRGSGDLIIWHIESREDGSVDERSKSTFAALTNRNSIKNALKKVEEGKIQGYIYFFNTKGGHPYLSGSDLSKIDEELNGSGTFKYIKQLINTGGHPEFTFYDDDLYAFGKSVEKLVTDVVSSQKSLIF